MLNGLTLLLMLQLAGESVARLVHSPVPGPVIGLVLTLFLLKTAPQVSEKITLAANGLLAHLSLLFVPAGVGVVLYLRELAADWFAITIALCISTVLGLAVTAWVAQRLILRAKSEHKS